MGYFLMLFVAFAPPELDPLRTVATVVAAWLFYKSLTHLVKNWGTDKW